MTILVSNLSVQIMASDLQALFSAYGTVSFVVVARDAQHGRSLGIAYITMPQDANGSQAVKGLNHQLLDGRNMSVQEIEYRAGEFTN